MGAKRIACTAVVRASDYAERQQEAQDGTMLDFVGDILGSTKWLLELEVRPVGGAPYVARTVSKVKNRLGGARGFLRQWYPTPGLEVPVLVNERDAFDIVVDWKGFVAEGGIARSMGGPRPG